MYQIISKRDFHDAFLKMDRKDNFSYEARNELYDFLTDIEENEIGNELDVISLCCEFTEESIKDALVNYNLDSLEELQENTLVIWNNNENVLYQCY
jgi:predicted transcriptional regulator